MRPNLMFDMTIDGDTLTGSDLEHREISVLVLYLLQSAPVQANMLLIQQVLAEPAHVSSMTLAFTIFLVPE